MGQEREREEKRREREEKRREEKRREEKRREEKRREEKRREEKRREEKRRERERHLLCFIWQFSAARESEEMIFGVEFSHLKCRHEATKREAKCHQNEGERK